MRKATTVNYLPVSLLPICGRIFERINLIQFLSFLKKTNYFPQINLVFDQMILLKSIYCQLSTTFMQILIKVPLKVRANFLDISKVFDKVEPKGFSIKT